MIGWPHLIREHGALVWQTALRLLGNDADAADCFQETFLSALRVAAGQAVVNWPGLLQRLATARALDALRKRRLLPAALDAALVADSDPSPAERLVNEELAESLAGALAQLPAQQAEAWCLRHLNELSYEQIARELGISTDLVGVHLHRARARLRELLSRTYSNPTLRGAP